MNAIVRFCVAILFVLALTSVGQAQETLTNSPYYPLKLGTTWHYKINDKDVLTRVTKYEAFDSMTCALVESSIDGKVIATEHIAALKNGIYRCAFNNVKAEPPLLLLKLPPKANEIWKIDTKIANDTVSGTFKLMSMNENVTVPAGQFKAILSGTGDMIIDGTTHMTSTYWFAPGKGIVKEMLTFNGSNVLQVLEQFESGK